MCAQGIGAWIVKLCLNDSRGNWILAILIVFFVLKRTVRILQPPPSPLISSNDWSISLEKESTQSLTVHKVQFKTS